MKKRKPNPELIDEENPGWTAADFKHAKPAHEILSELFNKEAAERLLKPKDSPKTPNAKGVD